MFFRQGFERDGISFFDYFANTFQNILFQEGSDSSDCLITKIVFGHPGGGFGQYAKIRPPIRSVKKFYTQFND